jgi:DNA-binding transcriptional regulator YiaG
MNSTAQQETNKLYQYRQCGLDNVYLGGGFSLIETPYGVSVKIDDVDGLHKCIAECLVRKSSTLTGAEFRFLRTELDLSQSAMTVFCGREERMIREWETGSKEVPEPANTIIRFLYEQRFLDPSAQYEEMAKSIRMFQIIDKKRHELKLGITDKGWKAECSKKAA